MSDDNNDESQDTQQQEQAAQDAQQEKQDQQDGDQGFNLNEMEGDLGVEGQEQEYAYGEPMAKDVNAIYDIPVQISAVLGRSSMQVSQLLKLGRGALVELDRKVGEPIDIYVNNRLVARGEVCVVEDKLGVTMTEIIKSDQG
jgi:flagellar motor switch protein FliN/FliY